MAETPADFAAEQHYETQPNIQIRPPAPDEAAAPRKRGRPKGSRDLKPRPPRRRPPVQPPAAAPANPALPHEQAISAKDALRVLCRHFGVHVDADPRVTPNFLGGLFVLLIDSSKTPASLATRGGEAS